jgi:hypothetical protein
MSTNQIVRRKERASHVRFSNLESIVKISNTFGKFGSLLIGHRDGIGPDAKDRNAIRADDLRNTSGGTTESLRYNTTHPRMGGPLSYRGPFSGKIVFRKGL